MFGRLIIEGPRFPEVSSSTHFDNARRRLRILQELTQCPRFTHRPTLKSPHLVLATLNYIDLHMD